MNALNKIIVTILIIFISTFTSCIEDSTFTVAELRFSKPFSTQKMVIYKSDKGQIDTIIFHAAVIDTIRYRNFAQGFYNENILRVSYELTSSSYHKFKISSVDNPRCFVCFGKAKRSHWSKEIEFLGLIFDKDYIERINTEKNVLSFSQKNAQYDGVNINEGIKSFTFDFERGIVSFIDQNSAKWESIN